MAKNVKKTPVKKPVKKTSVKTDKPEKKTKKAALKAGKSAVKAKGNKDTQASVQIPGPEKQKIILQFAVKSGDTGSPEVQIALLTQRIDKLVQHLKSNPHDNHSRRGLLGIVSKRRRLINYLEKKDAARVKDIKQKLGLT